ncbi:MAG: hypothetical protein H6Q90_3957 [Deltaproteobacteria bacterium]|nr:hypothetical protein [Deltaproteobacteria bacterium]
MRILVSLVFVAVTGLSGCGGHVKPAVGGSQTVLLPARPADCELELVTVQPEDMAPGARFGAGGQYQMIGVVSLGLQKGTDVMSSEVRKLVRPKACGYGGEVVSLLATGDSGHYQISGHSIRTVAQTDVVFTVWGPRATTTSAPQRF